MDGLYEFFSRLEKERLEYIGQYAEGDAFPPLLDVFSERIRKNVSDFREETINRLKTDAADIAGAFFDGRFDFRVTSVGHDGADFHAHGRCVLRIGTDRGVFYYKPRVSDMDRLFCNIADRWFSDVTKAPHLICRDGYSYASPVEPEEVETKEEAGRFYKNLGILLALFHALGSSDMHGGNIIAKGSYPVVIDMETMLVPMMSQRLIYPASFWIPKDDDLTFSVYSTVVLPSNQVGNLQSSTLYVGYNNTDCLPVLNGCQIPIIGYEGELIAGFKEGYRRILSIKEELMSLLNEHADIVFRYVLRPTVYYDRMLHELIRKEALESTQKQEEILSRLGNRFRKSGIQEMDILMEWEKAGLLEADFPFYQLRLDGKDLYGDIHDAPLIRNCVSTTALENANKRLTSMCEDELEFEVKLIETSLRQPFVSYAWWEKRPEADRVLEMGRIISEEETETLLSGNRLLIETGRIVSDIESLMITTPHGRHLWCGGNKTLLRTPGLPFIESGYAGLALFLRKYIMCAEGLKEEVSIRQAKMLLDICRNEISAYIEGFKRELENSDRQYEDMQVQGVERLYLVKRVLDGDIGAGNELEEAIFDPPDDAWETDPSALKTDVVAGGRAGEAGRRILYYKKTHDTHSLAVAKQLIAGIIAGKEKYGTYLTRKPSFHNSEDPSFYFGESGIGYVMLMLKKM